MREVRSSVVRSVVQRAAAAPEAAQPVLRSSSLSRRACVPPACLRRLQLGRRSSCWVPARLARRLVSLVSRSEGPAGARNPARPHLAPRRVPAADGHADVGTRGEREQRALPACRRQAAASGLAMMAGAAAAAAHLCPRGVACAALQYQLDRVKYRMRSWEVEAIGRVGMQPIRRLRRVYTSKVGAPGARRPAALLPPPAQPSEA